MQHAKLPGHFGAEGMPILFVSDNVICQIGLVKIAIDEYALIDQEFPDLDICPCTSLSHSCCCQRIVNGEHPLKAIYRDRGFPPGTHADI
jgi:hypothetical protein